MPRFCANLTMLFGEEPLPSRIGAASDAGFEAVEILFPYDDNAAELRVLLDRYEMPLALINGPPPNYTGGERGFAAVPASVDRFRRDFRRVLRYAKTLQAERIHLMAGVAEGHEAESVFIENLQWAADQAPEQPLTIEPINRADMPGYFLADFDLAVDVLEAVKAPNVRLQFDAYHAHRITGDVSSTWDKVKHLVDHVQVAGFPGRHEPDIGEIDYGRFFKQLDADGYQGWVSAEYNPKEDTQKGLKWLKAC